MTSAAPVPAPSPRPAPVRSPKKKGYAGSSRTRERSERAAYALEALDKLRRFFHHDAQLAQALGWDLATVADWRDHRVVRPQTAKVSLVLLLEQLCEEARAYLDSDAQVGQWLNAPLPNLRGCTAAVWLRERGRTGLRELTRGMVEWMPLIPDQDLEPIAGGQALANLNRVIEHDEAAREVNRMVAELG
jgi:hypothetical protein